MLMGSLMTHLNMVMMFFLQVMYTHGQGKQCA
uniref:Uncharacterized protein n=1 Tax=Rhizophora mucronata TaxID=61149 RepID=A0A2P2QIZ2_RHIMU